MLLSRGTTILKNVHHLNCTKPVPASFRQMHEALWCYRRAPPPDKKWLLATEITAGIAWWWVLWHFWHEFEHITGHFPYPRPCEWSDAHLGIPPDEEL